VTSRGTGKVGGVLNFPETPGGYMGHYSNIQTTGFYTLSPDKQPVHVAHDFTLRVLDDVRIDIHGGADLRLA